MDTVSPLPSEPVVRVKLDASVRLLRNAASAAVMKGDPLAGMFEALAASISALGDFSETSKTEQLALTSSLEAKASEVAAQALNKMQPEISGKLLDMAKSQLFAMRKKWIAVSAAAILIALTLAGGTTYVIGYNDGRAAGETASKTIGMAMASSPAAATAWAMLMANNDPVQALAACKKSSQANAAGRHYCALPVWLDPPTPPAAS